MKTSQSCRTDS